jgi:elongation factor G
MAFKTAAATGLKDAMAKAGVAILEPVSLLRVTVPSQLQGDVMGDINARRGRVQGSAALDGGYHEIVAHVPTAELLKYAVELRSLTAGRGRFAAEHDHYDTLPAHLVDKAKATLEGVRT